MWNKGTLKVTTKSGEEKEIRYWIKSFEEPSEDYGLEGGRISKLCLKEGRKMVANYDRGWDIKPETESAKKAYKSLVKKFN